MSVKKILVVDDDLVQLDMMHHVLTEAGYELLGACNAATGIAKAIAEQPDLVLMDIVMPGMDGMEACYALSTHPSTTHIPIIFLTCRTETSTVVQGFRSGAVDYITKPCDHDELIARIERLINPPSLQVELDRLCQRNVDWRRKMASLLQVSIASSQS